MFKDEDGREVRLGEYFDRRPVVLAFVYYECPMLCSQVLNGVTSALTVLDETRRRGLRRRGGELRPARDADDGGGEEEVLRRSLQARRRGAAACTS